jgi:galactose mutarotase-like enzyme
MTLEIYAIDAQQTQYQLMKQCYHNLCKNLTQHPYFNMPQGKIIQNSFLANTIA